jgi:hypothetical protein
MSIWKKVLKETLENGDDTFSIYSQVFESLNKISKELDIERSYLEYIGYKNYHIIGERVYNFNIIDKDHKQYKSTVCSSWNIPVKEE